MPDAAPQSKRFSLDRYLRKFGFKIRSRPKYGPDLWEQGALLLTTEEAVLHVREFLLRRKRKQ